MSDATATPIPRTTMTMTATRIIAHMAALLMLTIAWAGAAVAHYHWSWIMDYYNANGMNCCDERDAIPISHGQANSAQLGSIIVGEFPTGRQAVVVNKIYPTKDPEGRPWLTKWGCLFRWSGG